MELKKYDDFVVFIKLQLAAGKIVFLGVHANTIDGIATIAEQVIGGMYFEHVFYADYVDAAGKIWTQEADGKKVAWHDFAEYAAAIKSGAKELSVKWFGATPDQNAAADAQSRKMIGDDYDNSENIEDAIGIIAGWFTGIGTVISGFLKNHDLFGANKKENCSEACTLIARAAGNNVCPTQDAGVVTPTGFMSDPLGHLEIKTVKD